MRHANAQPFHGVLTFVGVASDSAPSGARGHRVVLTKDAAENALPSLIGMGVNWGADGRHMPGDVCGVIMEAAVVGNAVVVAGHLWAKDKKSDLLEIEASAEPLGMSYEVSNAHVYDMRVEVWILDRITFTGASIMPVTKAAYKRTTFDLL